MVLISHFTCMTITWQHKGKMSSHLPPGWIETLEIHLKV